MSSSENSVERSRVEAYKERARATFRKPLFWAVFAGGFIFYSLLIAYIEKYYSFGVNNSPSLPYEFFILSHKPEDKVLTKGTIIEYPTWIDYKDVHKKGDLFVKRIGCMPGQHLELVGDNFFCDKWYIGSILHKDLKGRDIGLRFNFNGTIPEGKYFALGDHERSFDSRYYGFVDESQISGVSIWEY